MNLSSDLNKNIDLLKSSFGEDNCIVYREFNLVQVNNLKCCVVFINGFADIARINDEILTPILSINHNFINSNYEVIDMLRYEVITSSEVSEINTSEKVIHGILNGNAVLLIDTINKALIVNVFAFNEREVSEPTDEKVEHGAKEGFNESIGTNISLIRKRIRNTKFKVIYKEIGYITKTRICICYLNGIASEKVIEELIRRLDKIHIDGILDSGYIQEIIKDSIFSPFKTIGSTERPDVVVGKLLEGRVAVLSDGSPYAITLPFIFSEYFQVSEDYYNNYIYSSIVRIIRWIGFFLATSVPAIYVALVTYHQEMIPTPLLLSIYSSRTGIPFPTIVEAAAMLFVFEVLREAGIRVPGVVGQTISIVGALVIGQSAVDAKIISAPIIIVTALSGITGFLTPKMNAEIVVLRILLLTFSSLLGLYGYIFCIIAIFIHLNSIRSFGIPFMQNIGSFTLGDQKDMILRVPWQYMGNRHKFLQTETKEKKNK